MKLLAQEIYTLLSSIGDTYMDMLEKNPDTDGMLIVYELNDADSKNTLDSKDYANDIDLTIKLLHTDTLALMDAAGQAKALLFGNAWEHCSDVTYNSSVPIFYDKELGRNQLTLLFSLYKPNTAG